MMMGLVKDRLLVSIRAIRGFLAVFGCRRSSFPERGILILRSHLMLWRKNVRLLNLLQHMALSA